MKILVDMNLSPSWADALTRHGFEAVHWIEVGDGRAPDRTIMAWARERGYVVFTHDLDFSALLATSRATGPSVIQIRAQDVLPDRQARRVAAVLRQYASALEAGALITMDDVRSRVRILPL